MLGLGGGKWSFQWGWASASARLHTCTSPLVFYHPSVETKPCLLSMSGHGVDLATTGSGPPRHIVAGLVRFGQETKCLAGDIFLIDVLFTWFGAKPLAAGREQCSYT